MILSKDPMILLRFGIDPEEAKMDVKKHKERLAKSKQEDPKAR